MTRSLLLALLALAASAPLAAQADVTVTGTAVLDGARLVITGDLEVEAGATLDAASGSLAFSGTAPSQLFYDRDGDGQPFDVHDLLFDKPSGEVLVSVRPQITGVLGLYGGAIGFEEGPATLAAVASGGELQSLAAIDGDGATLTNDALVYERFYERVGGWRLIASPFADERFTSLNDDLHTQGAENATFENGDPILFQWNAPSAAYVAVSDYEEPFDPGRGYFFYAFPDHPDGSPVLPARWDVEGYEHADGVTERLNYDGPGAPGSFNLLGNPFAAPLDWHLIQDAVRGLQATYHVWDPGANGGRGAYASYTTAGASNGNANRYVPAFQGFWVETNTGPFTVLAFDKAWKDPGATPLYVPRTEVSHQLRFHLEGETLTSADPMLLLLDGVTDGYDVYDAAWPVPLSADYAALFFVLGDAEATRRLVFESWPAGEALTARLGVETTRPGTYTLTWPGLDAAPAGPLVLVDEVTGTEIDLREATSYTFEVDGSTQKAGDASEARAAEARAAGAEAPHPRPVGSAALRPNPPRFALHVGGTPTGAEDDAPSDALPSTPALGAAYPNPFAAGLTVPYALPEAGDVRLEVFDVLGRRVAVLVDGPRPAGRHEARLSGRGLAAGTYLVRFHAGGVVQSQRVTLTR